MDLNDKQEAFVLEYLKDFNASQAAIRAGYSADSAGSIGHDLLKKPEIKARIKEHLEEVGVSTYRILGELVKIAFADAGDYVEIDPDTGAVRAKTLEELEPGASRAVKKVKEHRTIKETKNGDELILSCHFELEHHDKLKALELLGKHLGAFTDKIKISGDGPVIPVEVTFKSPDDPS